DAQCPLSSAPASGRRGGRPAVTRLGVASVSAAIHSPRSLRRARRYSPSVPSRSTASSRRSSGVVSEMRKKPSPLGPYAPPAAALPPPAHDSGPSPSAQVGALVQREDLVADVFRALGREERRRAVPVEAELAVRVVVHDQHTGATRELDHLFEEAVRRDRTR